jgi:hypothetical protein
MPISSNASKSITSSKTVHLKKLTPEQVKRIDEVLDSLDEYGEVRLVIQRGELRYINKVESFKAWKNGCTND